MYCDWCVRDCPGLTADGYCQDADREELARREKWLREGVYGPMATAGTATVSRPLPQADLAVSDEEDPFCEEINPEPLQRAETAPASEPAISLDRLLLSGGGSSLPAGEEDPNFTAAVVRQEPGLTVRCRWLESRYAVNVMLPGAGDATEALRAVGEAMKRLPDGTRVYILVQRRTRCQKEEFEVWGGEIWRDTNGGYQREVVNR